MFCHRADGLDKGSITPGNGNNEAAGSTVHLLSIVFYLLGEREV